MDKPESSVGGNRQGVGRRALNCLGFFVYLVAASLFSFLFVFEGAAIGGLLELDPASISSRCRILSSGVVDIRSSNVCKHGFLDYKVKQVFYPGKQSRFRCHYDYYWASIFEVEYKEYFSGQMLSGFVEVPKEALPVGCRPSFVAAWLTKMKFKVNETYDCNYILGSDVADLYPNPYFNCHAEGPSLWKMTRKVLIISRLLRPYLPIYKSRMERETMLRRAGMISGMMISVWMYIVFRILHERARRLSSRKLQVPNAAKRLKRVCLLMAYVSLVTWFMLEYGRTFGFNLVLYES